MSAFSRRKIIPPTSFFYQNPNRSAPLGSGGVKPAPKRYFNEAHKAKVTQRGNLERSIEVPLEDGQWRMAFDLATAKFRRAGLTANHLQQILAVAARNLQLLPEVNRSNSSSHLRSMLEGEDPSRSQETYTHAHRELASMLDHVKSECIEGNLPQSAGLWTQIVYLQAQLGMCDEGMDSAAMAMKCLRKAGGGGGAASSSTSSQSSSSPTSSTPRLAWGSRVGSSNNSDSRNASSPLFVVGGGGGGGGLSAATRQAMGEALLPVAAKQGNIDLAQQISKELLGVNIAMGSGRGITATTTTVSEVENRKTATTVADIRQRLEGASEGVPTTSTTSATPLPSELFTNASVAEGRAKKASAVEQMARRWLAEAYARRGDTEKALQLSASLSTSPSTSSSAAADASASSRFMAKDVFFKDLTHLSKVEAGIENGPSKALLDFDEKNLSSSASPTATVAPPTATLQHFAAVKRSLAEGRLSRQALSAMLINGGMNGGDASSDDDSHDIHSGRCSSSSSMKRLLTLMAIVDLLHPRLVESLCSALICSDSSLGGPSLSSSSPLLGLTDSEIEILKPFLPSPAKPSSGQNSIDRLLRNYVSLFRGEENNQGSSSSMTSKTTRLHELRAVMNVLGMIAQCDQQQQKQHSSSLLSLLLVTGDSALTTTPPPPAWLIGAFLASRVVQIPLALPSDFDFMNAAPQSPSSSSSSLQSSFYDAVLVDIAFGMLPVPAPKQTFIRWQREMLMAKMEENSTSPTPPSLSAGEVSVSTVAIAFLDALLQYHDGFTVSTVVARSAASALLNTDTSHYEHDHHHDEVEVGEGKKSLHARWRRALLLIRNSSINDRRRTTKKASPLELEVARIVTLLHRYGPTAECRENAVKFFPQLFPKHVVLDVIDGNHTHDDEEMEQQVRFHLNGGGNDGDDAAGKTAENHAVAATKNSKSTTPSVSSRSPPTTPSAVDDGSRPCDAEYDQMRFYKTYSPIQSNSKASSYSSAASVPLSRSSATLADDPMTSTEAARRGIDFYFKDRIQRTSEAHEQYDRVMRRIYEDKLRLQEKGVGGGGGEGGEGGDGGKFVNRNALGTTHSSSTLSPEALDKYWPAGKDPNQDPRTAPLGSFSDASGWSYFNKRSGSSVVDSGRNRHFANPMWPKQMPKLNNPLRSWRDCTPRGHMEVVRKWNGKSSV